MTKSDFSSWIGRRQEREDRISFNLVRRLAATFSEASPGPGDALPPLWHWAFFQDPVEASKLGADGHPLTGGFLPPVHGKNRMWAGSRIEFYEPLKVESVVTCVSTILDVKEKVGTTGSLLFVTVRHEYLQAGTRALQEEQDIVYRDPVAPKVDSSEAIGQGQWSEQVVPSTTMLFRYSAVTFNGHRIHYDWPYVTETEGYPGLVVHGPLTATLNLSAFLRANPKARLERFTFRGVRPLIAPTPFEIGGRIIEPGRAKVWAGNDAGVAQLGEVAFTLEGAL